MGDAPSPAVKRDRDAVDAVLDPGALQREIERLTKERYVARCTEERTLGFFLAVVVFAGVLCALPFHPVVRGFLRVGPGLMAAAMAAPVLAIALATLAAHGKAGILGAPHRHAERFESVVIAAFSAFLIRASGQATSVFWLIAVMHAFYGAQETLHGKWIRYAHGVSLGLLALSFALTQQLGEAAAVVFFTVLLLFLAGSNGQSAEKEIALQAERNVERARYESLLVERERQRIARDLHDGLGAQLASIAWSADADGLNEIAARARAVLTELREVVFGLKATERPLPELAISLEASCRRLASKSALSFTHAGNAIVPAELCLEIALFVREAVRNAAEHATPTTIDVHLEATAAELTVRIDDDGTGLPPDALENSRGGLSHLRERARQLHGALTFVSDGGRGTSVRLRVPMG